MVDPPGRNLLRTISMAGIGVLLVGGIVAAAARGGDGDDDPEPVPAAAGTVPVEPTVAPGAGTSLATTTTTTPAPTATTVRATPTSAPNATAPASSTVTTRPSAATARVQVKFVAGSDVRLRDGAFVSLSGHDLAPVRQLLLRYPGVTVERLFQRPEADLAAEKAAAEARTGQTQPDLNLYYLLALANGSQADALVTELGRLTIVEQAYRDPGAAPPPAPAP